MILANSDPTVNEFNEWLTKYALPISFIVAGVVFLTVLVLFIIAMVKRKKEAKELASVTKKYDSAEAIIKALGGEANIVSKSLNGSRIALVLNDYTLIDEEALNNNGVDSLIRMSNKLTLVSKDNSDKIYNSLP